MCVSGTFHEWKSEQVHGKLKGFTDSSPGLEDAHLYLDSCTQTVYCTACEAGQHVLQIAV